MRVSRLLFVMVLSTSLFALEVGPAAAAADEAVPIEYVALGDSYAAGPLIPWQEIDPIGCLRSTNNYAHLLARAIRAHLTDVSCSGAKVKNMTTPHNVLGGPNPPQFEALSTTTNLVTLAIGGNDIGFSELIASCGAILPIGSPCKNKYVGAGGDQISQRIAANAPAIGAAVAGIRTRAPQARVLVVGYPNILPEVGSGCWPVIPITPIDLGYLRTKVKELNAAIATQARANGATFVDTYTPSIGHDACKSVSVRWVEPVIPGNLAAPVHPNLNGMIAEARMLLAVLGLEGAVVSDAA